jgi:2-hydroxychromene-2-carboxylate isomerase
VSVAPPQVDFFYGLGSRYSYLAATQIARLETETGCRAALATAVQRRSVRRARS